MKMRASHWLIIVIALISVIVTQKSSHPEGRAFYKGLTVGSTQSQVLDALGEPDKKVQHDAGLMWYYGKGAEQRDPWGDPEIWFHRNGRVASIDTFSSEIEIGDSLVVVKVGDREESVTAKLGKPDVLADLSIGSTYHAFAEFHQHDLGVKINHKKKVSRIFIGSGKDSD